MNKPEPGAGEAALARVRVVLADTIHPGNIGAAARALKVMGLARLVLVNPQQAPDAQARAMAMGADDVLGAAPTYASLDAALAGTTLAIALSVRRRDLSPVVLDVRDAARAAIDEAARGGEVALVFGNEISGLSNDAVLRCQRVARIPTGPDFSSLNLAAAVQVVAYEVHRAAMAVELPPPARTPLATHEEREGLFAHLEASLRQAGFLDPGNPRRVMQRLRRLFERTQLESQEVNILRGMLSAWDERPRRGPVTRRRARPRES